MRRTTAMPRKTPAAPELVVDWTACDGRGVCAELLPELIGRDDWGYPVLARGPVPEELTGHARRAVRDCPTLALRLAARDLPAAAKPRS